MTNQTMRDCRQIVDGRVAMANQVVASQRVLIENMRGQGKPTLAAETTLARYRAARILHTPREEELRATFDTLVFLSPELTDVFVPTHLTLAEAAKRAQD